MNDATSGLETISQYGLLINTKANEFLSQNSRGTHDMYGMMRYFMGFTNEKFQIIPYKTGKRLRPGLLLHLAHCFGVQEEAVPAALSIELFHNFSLIHDDIVDGDELRHGRPTVWKVWGKDHALNVGDGQLILSMLALRSGNLLAPEKLQALETFLLERYLEVVEGQYLDFNLAEQSLTHENVTEKTYLIMSRKKTAVLFGTVAKTAGIIASRPEKEIEALYEFGINVGLAYQLFDDVQSLWGSEEKTGKASAGDIKERKKTLPIIYTRDHLSGDDKKSFVAAYDRSDADEESEQEIFSLIEKTSARSYTNERIEWYRKAALDSLQHVSLLSEQKETLAGFIEEIMPSL